MSHIPGGFHSITPYLIIDGADRLIEFLRQAFDAEVCEHTAAEDGTVRHASVRVGGSIVEISEARDEWPVMPGAIHMYVEDTDAVYASAIAAGASSLYEPADMPYGERSGGVQDPAGNHWYIATFTGSSAG